MTAEFTVGRGYLKADASAWRVTTEAPAKDTMDSIGLRIRRDIDTFLGPNIRREDLQGKPHIARKIGDYDVFYPEGLEGSLVLSQQVYVQNGSWIETHELWYDIGVDGKTQEHARVVAMIDRRIFDELEAGQFSGTREKTEDFLTRTRGFDHTVRPLRPDVPAFAKARDNVLQALRSNQPASVAVEKNPSAHVLQTNPLTTPI